MGEISRKTELLDEQFRLQEQSRRQFDANQKLIEAGEKELDLRNRQFEITNRQQREVDELRERQRTNEDRYEKLLSIWEEQARRFDAILDKWEQLK